MQIQLYKSEVIKNSKLNHKFNLVKLRSIEKGFIFHPGQYITLKITDSTFRCYSIFSLPRQLPYWEMFVDTTPGGPGTTLIKNLKIRDIVGTSCPSGTFSCEKDNNKNFIFVATGCGLAPQKSMIESLLNSSNYSKIFLVWGLRYRKDIALLNLLNSWTKNYSSFHFKIILSRPEEKLGIRKESINSYILKLVNQLPAQKTSVYISGNSEFVKDNFESLSTNNFNIDNIFFENYC